MGGDNPTNEKDTEPKAGRFWNKRHWPIVIGIVAVTCSTIDWEYRVNYIDSLKSELTATQKHVRDLTDQLAPFQNYANGEYHGDLSLLAKDLGEIDKMKSFFRPLDSPSRSKVVAAFRALQTTYGTTPIQVELTAEKGNMNLNLVVDELASILKEAGLDASVGQPQVGKVNNSSNAPEPLQIRYNAGEYRLMMSFVYSMTDNFMAPPDLHYTPNIPQTGKLTVQLVGDPRFSADGHVSFNGNRVLISRPRGSASDALAARSN